MNKKHLHIVFCGIDGSGKSTWVEEVLRQLRMRREPAISLHGHGYTFAPHSFGISETSFFRIKHWFKVFWPLALIDHWYTYLTLYLPVLRRSALVADRYFYDKLARLLYYGMITRSMARWYLKFIPRPDVTIFLDVKPELAFKRKPDFTLEQFTKLREEYRFLASTIRASIIDTSQARRNSRKQIFSLI